MLNFEAGCFQVRFVDYGDIEFVSKDNLQPVLSSQTKLPAQALSCELAGIESRTWSEDAKRTFEGQLNYYLK